MTDLSTDKSIDIKRQQFIQCRYTLFQGHQFLAGGVVRDITDSTLIYSTTSFSAKREIPLSAITNLDKVPIKRSILPAIALGLIFGVTDHYINPKRSQATSSVLATIDVLIGVNYVLKWNRRHLNRNIIGETTRLEVIPIEVR
ncbi:hypothetical protein [Spirosoma flavum]|uniref:Uncharacterized protein n=1 Tax=Spirosoma flavum TaxID=2048557 RepID=A0ABW6AIP3_9BACT